MTTDAAALPAHATFDVRGYARTAQGSLRDELDLAAFASQTLHADVVRTLAVLRDLEAATMAHLRNVLVTPTHKDARVTAFLVTWAFEKFWIADALDAIVAVSGGPVAAAASDRDARGARGGATGGGPVRRAFAGFVQGWPVIGAHMTLGLVDDWMLRAAYEHAVDISASDALVVAVRRILAVKDRQTRFFDDEARRRLAASPKASRLARRELRRAPLPIGTVNLAPDDRTWFARSMFGGTAGADRADALAHRISDLPGIDGATAAAVRRRLSGPGVVDDATPVGQ